MKGKHFAIESFFDVVYMIVFAVWGYAFAMFSF
jgi:TctA family transporter